MPRPSTLGYLVVHNKFDRVNAKLLPVTAAQATPLYSIKEEDDSGVRNNNTKSFRRKIFARSKTQQATLSISPESSYKSLKSSNQSLSSLKKQVSFDDSASEVFDVKQQHQVTATFDPIMMSSANTLTRPSSRYF